jgi:hypothetical protein
MSDNKPPMTVWAHEDAMIHLNKGRLSRWTTVAVEQNEIHNIGPYVHLKQFLEDVERRASCTRFPHARNNAEAGYYAMQELAKEIEDGGR